MTELTRPDWRTPIQASAEETYWSEPSEGGSDQPRRSIRWMVSQEGLERITRLEACMHCLTGFPAPPRKENWSTWKTSGFRFLYPLADSKRLVLDQRCPICKGEITAEMLDVQIDDEWQEEDAKLKEAKYALLDDDRERDEHLDNARIEKLGLRDPVAPPSKRKSMKRRGES